MVSVRQIGANLHTGHESLYAVRDAASGLDALIAIHSTALGPAFGGCRMRPYPSRQAALRDALRLSHAMTRKAAMAGLPFGGGKCVVIGDPATQKTEALLLALAEAIHSLGGAYLTADDSGTTVRDMELMRRVTPHARGLVMATGQACPAAAYGTFMAIQAAVAHRFGRTDLKGRRIAVQGLGQLGMALCAYLAEAGARLFVADALAERVEMARRAFGAVAVPTDQILSCPADVLSPNAYGGVISAAVVDRIRAPIVAGGANNQLVSSHLGEALHRRGILFVPDYVANVGGVIDVAMEGPGYSPDKVLRACESIFQTTARLLTQARRLGLAPAALADRMAADRVAQSARGQSPLAMEMSA